LKKKGFLKNRKQKRLPATASILKQDQKTQEVKNNAISMIDQTTQNVQILNAYTFFS